MNMHYCMYQNTLQDLRQVKEDMERRQYPTNLEDDEPLSAEEERARKAIVQLCRDIVDMEGDE